MSYRLRVQLFVFLLTHSNAWHVDSNERVFKSMVQFAVWKLMEKACRFRYISHLCNYTSLLYQLGYNYLPEGYKGKYDPHFSPSGYHSDQSEPLFCFMQAIISSDLQTLYHISTTASYAYGAHTITVCVPQRITQIWEADAHYLILLIRANYLSLDLPHCKLSSILD